MVSSQLSLVRLPSKLKEVAPTRPAGDPQVMSKMNDINQAPANFMGKSKNHTINMLEHMMFNLDQL